MPVPDFNSSDVLPPHLGDPRLRSQLSPFPVTALEICQKQKLSTSSERRKILHGWLQLRGLLRQLGYNNGFQWVDGSFMEDCEKRRGRPPGDIDVVSFLPPSAIALDPAIVQIISDRKQTKALFSVDHLIVPLEGDSYLDRCSIVESTRYWCGLFSHRRDDGVWKGMLAVDLNAIADDAAAELHLKSLAT